MVPYAAAVLSTGHARLSMSQAIDVITLSAEYMQQFATTCGLSQTSGLQGMNLPLLYSGHTASCGVTNDCLDPKRSQIMDDASAT